MFLIIIAIFALVLGITPSLTNPTGFVVAENSVNESEEHPSFRIYTKAVCENISNFVVCHDELFANCGNLEYMLPKNEVNGNGVFDKDWEDPRNG